MKKMGQKFATFFLHTISFFVTTRPLLLVQPHCRKFTAFPQHSLHQKFIHYSNYNAYHSDAKVEPCCYPAFDHAEYAKGTEPDKQTIMPIYWPVKSQSKY
jgi:hypothetical protein